MEIVSPSLQRGNLSPSLEYSYNTPLINLPTTCLAEPRCSNGICCIYPYAGPAPLGIVVVVAIGIAEATQLRCAPVEATQLGMGIGSTPEGAEPRN